MPAIYQLLSKPFIALTIVVLAWGVIQLVRRNRLLVALVTGIVVYGIYVGGLETVWRYLYYHYYHSTKFTGSFTYMLIWSLGLGAIFTCVGLFLYERYAEV